MCRLQSLSTPADATAQFVAAAGKAGMASPCGSSHPAAVSGAEARCLPLPEKQDPERAGRGDTVLPSNFTDQAAEVGM